MFKICLRIAQSLAFVAVFLTQLTVSASLPHLGLVGCIKNSLPLIALSIPRLQQKINTDKTPKTMHVWNGLKKTSSSINPSFVMPTYPETDTRLLHPASSDFCIHSDVEIKKTTALGDAKNFFKRYGHYDMPYTLEYLQFQAISEYAKPTISTCGELSLLDYDALKDDRLIHSIPYAYGVYDAPVDKSVRVRKQKILMRNEEPVGWVQYSYDKKPNGTYENGYVDYIGVKENQRANGYGAYLMTYALQEMEIVGVRCVGLYADNELAAKFHKKMGFKEDKPGSPEMQKTIEPVI